MFGGLGRNVGPLHVIAIYQIKCHKIAITNQRTKRYESQNKNHQIIKRKEWPICRHMHCAVTNMQGGRVSQKRATKLAHHHHYWEQKVGS